MTLRWADRVNETVSVSGTGSVTLGASIAPGYIGFSSIPSIATGDTFYYLIFDQAAPAFELGLGTYTAGPPTTFSRSAQASSNFGSLVSFAGNPCSVQLTMTAESIPALQNRYVSNTYTASGAIAVTDDISIVNASSTTTMTLSSGLQDGHALQVKRMGSGNVVLTANMDGTSQSVTMSTVGLKGFENLRWVASLGTWITG